MVFRVSLWRIFDGIAGQIARIREKANALIERS